MKTNRIVSLIMATLLSTMVAGCGKKNTTTNNQPTDPNKPLAPLEINALLTQYNQPPDPNGEFWKDMEKTYNVKYTIEWVAESAYSDKVSLVLASGTLPDLIQLISTTDASVVNAINKGLLMDLTPHLDFKKYPNLGKINGSAWINSKVSGKNYVFPRSRGQYNTALFIRGDWLDKLGMKTPTTIDEFEKYLRGIKNNADIKGNKKGDIIPLPVEVNTIMSFVQGAFGPGSIVPVFTADKTGVVHSVLTESYALGIDWLKKLYNEGLYPKEFALYNTDRNQDILFDGLGGARHQNAWHRFRLSSEIKKVDPNGYVAPVFGLKGPGGVNVEYDKGFYGGHALNAKLSAYKRDRILDFFNKTADPDKYRYFVYGMEGKYYNIVDGFPILTDLGKKEVTNSFYGPYVVATDLYNKVDSPLADAKYNKETREMVKVVDTLAASVGSAPFKIFEVISSKAWSQYWAINSKDFSAYVADTIAGKHTIDEFRAYQKKIASAPEVQTAFKEFKASYDEFGLANWKAK
jgi:putative aldouronate transport system substrate-binding protein